MEVVDVQDDEVRAAVVIDVSDCDRRPLIPEDSLGAPVRNVLPGGPARDPPGRVKPAADPEPAVVGAGVAPSPHLEDHESEACAPKSATAMPAPSS